MKPTSCLLRLGESHNAGSNVWFLGSKVPANLGTNVNGAQSLAHPGSSAVYPRSHPYEAQMGRIFLTLACVYSLMTIYFPPSRRHMPAHPPGLESITFISSVSSSQLVVFTGILSHSPSAKQGFKIRIPSRCIWTTSRAVS